MFFLKHRTVLIQIIQALFPADVSLHVSNQPTNQRELRSAVHRRNPTAVRHQCAQCCDSENEHSAVTAKTSTAL